MPEPSDLKLWNKVKILADKVYERPSAYKSGYIVKKYKELGGTFKGVVKMKGLKRWFAEEWVNQHDDVGYQHKKDVYRPSKRITKSTPKTWSELTKKQIEKAELIKSSGRRVLKF